jgi:hypothetical protein
MVALVLSTASKGLSPPLVGYSVLRKAYVHPIPREMGMASRAGVAPYVDEQVDSRPQEDREKLVQGPSTVPDAEDPAQLTPTWIERTLPIPMETASKDVCEHCRLAYSMFLVALSSVSVRSRASLRRVARASARSGYSSSAR